VDRSGVSIDHGGADLAPKYESTPFRRSASAAMSKRSVAPCVASSVGAVESMYRSSPCN
jgi:hypothetical protein